MSDHSEELFEDAGGSAPDNVPVVLVALDYSLQIVIHNLSFRERSRIEKGSKRHNDQLGDLYLAELKGIGIRDDANKGGNYKLARCHNIVEGPENLNILFLYSDFLKGFPESGSFQILVSIVKDPSGEGDLPLVMFYLVGSLGEEDVATAFFGKKSNKDRGAGKRRVAYHRSLS